MTQSTKIVVSCPECQEARLGAADVTLRYCIDDQSWSYRFTCPSCCRRAVRPTAGRLAVDALTVGVEMERWSLPTDLLEPHAGPALTTADLAQFHAALAEPNWFDELGRAREEDCSG